jgi:predicted nucleic acid-binding protein
MIVVIDANILFSAVITPNGKIAEILGHPSLGAQRITCRFLVHELQKHLSKIV